MSAEATSSKATPFSVLSDIARRSYQMASGLPEQDEAVELFNGIGFSLAGQRYVAPMGRSRKYWTCPALPRAGVRNFLLGLPMSGAPASHH